MRKIPDIEPSDKRFLLAIKYYIGVLLNSRVDIKTTLDLDICVLCTKGYMQRIKQLEEICNTAIKNAKGKGSQETRHREDAVHEIKALTDYLKTDKINDAAITIFGSTVLYENDTKDMLCEFDGFMLYPNREENQLILLEAKNTKRQPGYAKSCLRHKLEKLCIPVPDRSINVQEHEAYFQMSL